MKWLEGSDPTWHKKVLAKLEEKYPEIAAEVWGEVIDKNAEEQIRLRKMRDLNIPDAGNSGTH